MSHITEFSYENHWHEVKIDLERSIDDNQPLGFFIAGGLNTNSSNHRFTSIIVTKIIENSLVDKDKRLKLYDIILSVNNIDFTNINEQNALNILRKARPTVQLIVRRLSPLIIEEIELQHNGKLGMTIAGGIDIEHYANDPGIFVISKENYQTNAQFNIGDRLIEISSTNNTYDLRFVTFEDAKKYIRLACKESQIIKLSIGHPKDIIEVQNSGNDLSVTHSEEDDKDQMILSFTEGDYQRYERYGKRVNDRLLHEQNINKLAIVPRVTQFSSSALAVANRDFTSHHYVNIGDEKSNTVNRQNYTENNVYQDRDVDQSNLYDATIREAHAEKLRRQEADLSQTASQKRNNNIGNE
ncbi:hypothetical protein I4U23_012663 [Adineta vaga]|nr:hypothetical protein I4U23_012663 [Adineta vaga]